MDIDAARLAIVIDLADVHGEWQDGPFEAEVYGDCLVVTYSAGRDLGLNENNEPEFYDMISEINKCCLPNWSLQEIDGDGRTHKHVLRFKRCIYLNGGRRAV